MTDLMRMGAEYFQPGEDMNWKCSWELYLKPLTERYLEREVELKEFRETLEKIDSEFVSEKRWGKTYFNIPMTMLRNLVREVNRQLIEIQEL